MELDTKLIHVGHETSGPFGDVVPPIHVASTFDQHVQEDLRYFYGRGENPTREALERCLASLENAQHGLVLASGQAAGATVLSLLTPGQRVLASDDVYGGTFSLFRTLDQYGIRVDPIDLTDLDALDAALADDVALIWIETPTNPLLKVADIAAVVERARRYGALVLVDNTFASPVLQQPLAYGADITLYSTTKFIAGHSDVIGGALVYNDDDLHRRFSAYRTAAGNIPGSFDCFLVHRGLKTLSLRVERQVATTQRIVEVLAESPRVGRLHYPGLDDHPQHEVAARQMVMPGSIVTFEYLGDVAEMLRRCELFTCAVSLGSVRSLIECPALMTHRPIPQAERLRLGITDNMVRLSLGVEDPRDLVKDLSDAL
jgi:methionine gamma-lyase